MSVRLNAEVNSGAAYLLSFAAILGYAFFVKAPMTEFWVGVASLYGWHTGRRLWRQFKCGTRDVQDGGDPTQGDAK